MIFVFVKNKKLAPNGLAFFFFLEETEDVDGTFRFVLKDPDMKEI